MFGLNDRVLSIIEEKLNIPKEKIRLEDDFTENLGADSLECMELIMEFEDTFEVDIPEEKFSSIKTVRDAIELIQRGTSRKQTVNS